MKTPPYGLEKNLEERRRHWQCTVESRNEPSLTVSQDYLNCCHLRTELIVTYQCSLRGKRGGDRGKEREGDEGEREGGQERKRDEER